MVYAGSYMDPFFSFLFYENIAIIERVPGGLMMFLYDGMMTMVPESGISGWGG